MKEETKKRIEYLLAPAIERGLNGVVEAIRRLADAVGRLEAEPPRWYEIAGRSICGRRRAEMCIGCRRPMLAGWCVLG